MRFARAALVSLAAAALLLAGCSGAHKSFRIAAGSEEKTFEPIVQQFCADQRVTCEIEYKGSLDIGLMPEGEGAPDFDAVWPASSLWLDLYDAHRRVKNLKSIASSPVILGVRMSKARELGWIGKPVHMSDILDAVNAGRFSFLMTSATQSNSGASAYLAMLAASFGTPDRLDPRALDDPNARAKVKALLKGVARSSGSSGWLKDLYLSAAQSGRAFDGMWNYEAVLKETNDELRKRHQELLYAVYPADGTTYADAPLGYVERGQPDDTRKFFAALQAHLLTPEVQAQIAAFGRRTALGMAKPAPPEKDWNFDPGRVVPSIALPEPKVIARALVLYQEVLRKPSLTAICLDFSGSMQGEGESQLKAAMRSLFDPAQAARSLIQWTPLDRIFIIPFDADVRNVSAGDGTVGSQTKLLAAVQGETAGGGTDMYACAERALQEMQPFLASGQYLPALVIMTDGKSEKRRGFDREWAHEGYAIPIFGVTFGEADTRQLDDLAQMTQARVFDGRTDLTEAFRSVRGYN
ncbi:MAG TPA: VWA domain-containing protein [Rhizomicrobium sp.]|nr:VWA domain-containing protein [Rhizomicrobium sp.]